MLQNDINYAPKFPQRGGGFGLLAHAWTIQQRFNEAAPLLLPPPQGLVWEVNDADTLELGEQRGI